MNIEEKKSLGKIGVLYSRMMIMCSELQSMINLTFCTWGLIWYVSWAGEENIKGMKSKNSGTRT